ncbi:mechanosensitive ion channel family protein [Sphingosinicella rhizophila]|uniref:Mechanosensitive ion channel n=1 Tax=Sphingosinicella rhizophila TaxID=3050082 RepID=A0ABU3Q7T9_9SPHN|nr:mechanosensitive ion channel domain-containing protein [Sphingosinicella sp. GR2756]MDT9599149.1 mechanosensitive ion channel [Sphingosinicella sp. GR2756]
MNNPEALHILGIRLVGATPENGSKLLLSLAVLLFVLLFTWIGRRLTAMRRGGQGGDRLRFWARQAISLAAALIFILGIVSIWFDDPTRLTTALGLVTAGLAFALQRVITATAGYFIILRGKTFNVGDRIVMGGVRGDVMALTFMQTKILEMGQPPAVEAADPAQWVRSRQYTGRIVTVSNDKIFDEPVYNYTYHFPYIWEEMRLPIAYRDDRDAAERILKHVAKRHAVTAAALDDDERAELERRYNISVSQIEPKVYWRITDNWLELSVRFLVPDHGVRDIKDAMSREIMARLDEAGIGIASATYELTGVPALRIARGDGGA